MTKFAQFISNLFDPMPSIVLVGLIGIFATPMSYGDRLFWLLFVGALGALVAVILLWFIRRGYVLDARLTDGKDDLHKDRLGVLWITVGLLGLTVLAAWWFGRMEPLWSILLSMLAVLGGASLITARYKVSIHMVGITSLVTVLLIQYGRRALIVLVLIPLVAWSRSVLHRHTPFQLTLGTTMTALLIVTVFWLTGQLT